MTNPPDGATLWAMGDEPPKKPRFDKLELEGAKGPAPAPTGTVACPRCGKFNEPERETCWACFQLLKERSAAPDMPRTPPAQAEESPALKVLAFSAGYAAAAAYPSLVFAEWNSITQEVLREYAIERKIAEASQIGYREAPMPRWYGQPSTSYGFQAAYPHLLPLCMAFAMAAWTYSRADSIRRGDRIARSTDALTLGVLAAAGAVLLCLGERYGALFVVYIILGLFILALTAGTSQFSLGGLKVRIFSKSED